MNALLAMPDGTLVANGTFTSIGGTPAPGIARWNGASWAPIGSTPTGGGPIARMPNGDLVVGGRFPSLGGTSTNLICARWNGNNWLPLGTLPLPGYSASFSSFTALAVSNGYLVAAVVDGLGALFATAGRLLVWNGTTWGQIAAVADPSNPSGGRASINALAVLPNGDLVVVGEFVSIGGVAANGIARTIGGAWSGVGSGQNITGVGRCVLTLANGDLLVGGSFNSASAHFGVLRWNGMFLSGVGSPSPDGIQTLLQLPDGDILAGGLFSMLDPVGRPANNLARWNGTGWFATNLSSSLISGVGVSAITNSEIALGDRQSPYLLRVTSTCPATATAVGNGCPSSGGSNTLRADTLPWLGSNLVLSATGLPPLAFAAVAIGATPIPQGSVPLASLFALAGPGCDALVVPDLLEFLVANGTARSVTAVPDAAALIGVSVRAQMAVFEVDTAGTTLAITATNALQLTVGSL